MVSYEAAQKFRENANVPLTWDETVPAPPLDRIELTRRILEAAEVAGLGVPVWKGFMGSDDTEEKFEVFQKLLSPAIPNQQYSGIPQTRWSGWTDYGMHFTGVRNLNWAEYIESLEEDYYKPWETAWRFGACRESAENVLRTIKDSIAKYLCTPTEANPNATPYPDAEQLQGDEVIARYLSLYDGEELSDVVRWEMGFDYPFSLPLVERRWMGMKEDYSYPLTLTITLGVFVAAVYGAVKGLFSGWWLIAIVPALLVAGFFGLDLIHEKRYWINKSQTFDEWIARIVAAKQHEWAELQNSYAAP